jgi:Flp pilus assembly protein TadD
MLRAWLAQARGKGSPLALIDAGGEAPLAKAYIPEQRALLLLAGGKFDEGLAALKVAAPDETLRSQRLRIAGAALLARKGRRAEALALLEGGAAPLALARRRLQSGKSPGPELSTPAAALAELLLAMSLDLTSQEVQALALNFARLATFLSPENAVAHLVVSESLARDRRFDAALAALAAVPADDPFAADAVERRVSFLAAAGRKEEALTVARAAATAASTTVAAWTRLGDILTELDRHAEAAEAYGKALDLARSGAEAPQPLWGLWLLRGSALTRAGRWEEGRAALQESHKLAPDQAVVLNYLGYSQLERRENIAEATRLIAEASKLQPDDAAITDSLGWAHFVGGDVARAIPLLELAAQGEPADAAINEHLGDAYYAAGRRFEARYAWSAALTYAEGEAAARLRAKLEAGLRPDLAAP